MVGRLKRRAEFLKVAASNRKWVAPGLILQVCRHRPSPDILHDSAARETVTAPSLLALHQDDDAVDMVPASAPVDSGLSVSGLRVGFTASRKVGNAVCRNRAKRRLRAAAQEILPDYALPGHDLVLIARHSTGARDWPALLGDLRTGLRKLGVWRDSAPDRNGS